MRELISKNPRFVKASAGLHVQRVTLRGEKEGHREVRHRRPVRVRVGGAGGDAFTTAERTLFGPAVERPPAVIEAREPFTQPEEVFIFREREGQRALVVTNRRRPSISAAGGRLDVYPRSVDAQHDPNRRAFDVPRDLGPLLGARDQAHFPTAHPGPITGLIPIPPRDDLIDVRRAVERGRKAATGKRAEHRVAISRAHHEAEWLDGHVHPRAARPQRERVGLSTSEQEDERHREDEAHGRGLLPAVTWPLAR